MGLTTCPDAVMRVGTAGVGGEKSARGREGMAESSVGRAEGGGGSGRDIEGLGWGCVERGVARGTRGTTGAGAVSSRRAG